MKMLVSLVLTAIIATPCLAVAQEKKGPIRAAAERLAGETELQGNVNRIGTRRSMGRVSLGLALAGAGVAMLLIDPKQPTQPQEVSLNTLTNETAAFLASSTFASLVNGRGTTYFCYPNFLRSCEFTASAYVSGVVDGGLVGAAGALAVATQGERTVYSGQIQPFEKRKSGLKYGGAAMAIGGALIAGFWSDVPVLRSIVVAPTAGGVRLSTAFGF